MLNHIDYVYPCSDIANDEIKQEDHKEILKLSEVWKQTENKTYRFKIYIDLKIFKNILFLIIYLINHL